jgi:two-component system CheB/CheR fusion protein
VVPNAAAHPSLDDLLEYLKRNRGFDFTGYKRSTLQRRITKRMEEVGVDSYDGYLDYLEVQPDEFPELFNTILINVTAFFRDPPAWEYLREDVVPAQSPDLAPGGSIPAWYTPTDVRP